MARTSDLLRRFRLMAVPGRAGIAGVPIDRAAELREELAPVFAALRATEDHANEIVARATAEGERRIADADLEAQRMLREAERALPGERAAAAASVGVEASSEVTRLLTSADHEVERIERVSNERIAPVVDELVHGVLSLGATTRTSS